MTHYSNSATVTYDYNDNITFSGIDDTMTFGRCASDTITATGTNQTLAFGVTGDQMTVKDHGSGLHIQIGQSVLEMTIKDFQNDPAGKVMLALGSMTASIAPDGHGGSMMTILGGGGVLSGDKLDFVGDKSLTMAQVVHL